MVLGLFGCVCVCVCVHVYIEFLVWGVAGVKTKPNSHGLGTSTCSCSSLQMLGVRLLRNLCFKDHSVCCVKNGLEGM